MKWEQLDLKKRTLRIPETKNNIPRTVLLSREALRILSDLPRRIDGYVWGSTPDWLSHLFANSCKKLGLKIFVSTISGTRRPAGSSRRG
ncbi:MAG: hypothetical protein M0041_08210 [Nitrospiraceae bacterium]|nr:hypothetical protein [Nitrospiraceae bacterium]